LVKEIVAVEARRERSAALRAGLVASAIYNVHRKKGARTLKPTDFIRTEPKTLSPQAMREELIAWARDINDTRA